MNVNFFKLMQNIYLPDAHGLHSFSLYPLPPPDFSAKNWKGQTVVSKLTDKLARQGRWTAHSSKDHARSWLQVHQNLGRDIRKCLWWRYVYSTRCKIWILQKFLTSIKLNDIKFTCLYLLIVYRRRIFAKTMLCYWNSQSWIKWILNLKLNHNIELN